MTLLFLLALFTNSGSYSIDKKTVSKVPPIKFENTYVNKKLTKSIDKFIYNAPTRDFSYHAFHESKSNLLGKGNYWLFNGTAPLKIFLQAPHKYHDSRTGKILLKMLNSKKFLLAGTNSIHRYKGKPKNHDLAHLTQSYLLNLTKAFAADNKGALIIQLHGFNEKKRSSKAAQNTDIIISSGLRNAKKRTIQIYKCLLQKKLNTLLYGDNVFELGGTTNTIGKYINSYTDSEFLHIEMSSRFRKQVLNDRLLMQGLLDCITL